MSQEATLLALIVAGRLEIREDGSIWRREQLGRTGRWREVEPVRADALRPDGYRRVRVQMYGKVVSALGHRLVWLSSGGEIPVDREINHRNGRKGDNRLSNLEVVTKSENQAHAYAELGRFRPSGQRNGRAVLDPESVAAIRRRVSAGESHRAVAADIGICRSSVGAIARGELWRSN